MHVLVLGGTRFVGRAIVEELLDRGHQVTLANRGQSNDGVFGCRVTTIHLDRLDSLAPLGSGTWDACIDTCAYVPRAVRMVGETLHGRVGRYVLISTISVYADPEPGANEDAPLIEVGDPSNEVVDAQTYGYLKVLCEREAISQFPAQTTVIRPGIVVGPHDPTDRFTYWVHRIATELAVLYPAKESAAQWIDARPCMARGGLDRTASNDRSRRWKPSTLARFARGNQGNLESSLPPCPCPDGRRGDSTMD